MSDKSELVNQLKIDRTEHHASRGWAGGLGAGALTVALAVGAFAYYRTTTGLIVSVAVASPVSSDLEQQRGTSLDASGYVVARRQATVSSKITGKVIEVLIEEGQRVERGQVVARLDDTNARAAVNQAEAQLEQAKANLKQSQIAQQNAQPIFERNREQFTRDIISAQTFDEAKASYDIASTAVEVAARAVDVAAANLAIAERNLDDTIVRAPFAGIVTVKAAQEGEMVSPVTAGGGFTRTGIGTIVDMDSLEVEVDVSENFINRVHHGQDATVELNAYPGWVIPANVIAIIPTADRARATVRVRVGLEERDARILPQMGVRVSFLTTEGNDARPSQRAVVVASEAIQINGDRGVAFQIDGNVLTRRALRLGPETADGQVVIAGLEPGALLAIGEFDRFSDGIRVRIANP
jgi:RND family efflux transporter MFP subunit